MNMPSKSRPSREQHAASIAAFQQEGLKNARAIGNRGPVRFDADGKLQPDILDAYNEHGFADKADDYRFNEETFDRVIRDYFNKDLAI